MTPMTPVRDLVYHSNRLVRLLRAAVMAEFAHLGLSPRQAAAVNLLVAHTDGMSMSQLADGIGVDRPTLTGVVDRLARAGWVDVVVNDVDRRSRVCTLSAVGREQADDIVRAAERATVRALCGLTDDEAQQLMQLLVRAGDALEES